jgi:hypothetical protein
VRLWQDELERLDAPPYGVGSDSLFIAYFASSELSVHLALDWPLPQYTLDLFIEFRVHTNGRSTEGGRGLLAAAVWHGLDAISADQNRVTAIWCCVAGRGRVRSGA